MKQCLCTKSITCKNRNICHHARIHDCIVPAYKNNKGMCSHNRDAECLVVDTRCDRLQRAVSDILYRIEYLTTLQNTPPMEYKMERWPDTREMRPRTSEEKRAIENKSKPCFRKDCNNNRGDRGLYCSPECHRLDN